TDFGGGPLVRRGGTDVFVLRLTADGAHAWSRIYGSGDFDAGMGITEGTSGAAYVTGYLVFREPIVMRRYIFILKLAPNGTQEWLRLYGENGIIDGDYGAAVSATLDGGVFVALNV